MTLLLAGWRRLRTLPRSTRVGVPLLCAVLLALPAAWPERADDAPLLTRVTGLAAPDPSESDAPDEPVEIAAGTTEQPTPAAATSPPAPTTAAPPEPGVLIGPMTPDRFAAASLTRFSACDEFLTHAKGEATKAVGPWGIPWGHSSNAMVRTVRSPAPSSDAAPAAGAGEAVDRSDTNVQEVGVDEPDVVEADGRHLFVLDREHLRVVEASGGEPRLVATLPAGEHIFADGLLLAGDRLAVLTRSLEPPFVAPDSDEYVPSTRLELFDVSQPASPRLLSTFDVNGHRLDVRAVDGKVRLVVRSGPMGLPFVYPEDGTEEASEKAVAENRRVIADSTAVNWLPVGRITREGRSDTRALVDCDGVHRPDDFAGLDTVSVVTFDMATGEVVGDGASVLTGGGTVYANRERLYVTSTEWNATDADAATTALHQFSLASGGAATYVASGRVRGVVGDQFSMSEHGGRLRVASTGTAQGTTESFVTILETHATAMAGVGQIGGLGRGERIYAVRFMGDVGYVVTFRQVDPLYVLDLSDPTAPTVRGELKIPGYSAYLHPVGDGLLLGVGQDADEQGFAQGAQVSLFDVSDPARPTRLDQRKIGDRGTTSESEWDHHAFLWWEPAGLAVAPYSSSRPDGSWESGAAGIRVEGRRLVEVGRLTHVGEDFTDAWRGHIRRTVVVGGTLYTVSDGGVLASELSTFARKGWAKFD